MNIQVVGALTINTPPIVFIDMLQAGLKIHI